MTDFVAFMAQRERAEFGHHKPSVAENNKQHRAQCHYLASDQAKSDPSDPFVYNRAMSHMMQGITLRGDYEVELHKEQDWSSLDPKYKIDVLRPRNRKEPCI